MVERDLKGRDITDKKVLEVMGRVERHKFVSKGLQDTAYADHPLPIGEGQTISQPYIVALMTQILDLKEGEKVLEIGDRKSTRLNSSHIPLSRMPSSA